MRYARPSDLQKASHSAHAEYVLAQCRLLARLDLAFKGEGAWPDGNEYAFVEMLGREASTKLREYLNSLNVPSKPRTTRAERVLLIQRLSANERRWQPTPEDWLGKRGP